MVLSIFRQSMRCRLAAAFLCIGCGQALHTISVGRKLYLTYERFPGQLNNQLFQLAAAIQHAHLLGRTLLVPPETRKQDWTGMFQPELHLWNLTSLHRKYDVEFYDDDKHYELLRAAQSLDNDCYVKPGSLPTFLKDALRERTSFDELCPIINLGGKGGLLMCKSQNRFCGNATEERVAIDVYQHFDVHNSLMHQLPKDHFVLGVHSRTHGKDRYTGNGDIGVCLRGVTKTLLSHAKLPVPDAIQKAAQAQCTLVEEGALEKQIGTQRASWGKYDTLNFLLCDDGAHEWKPMLGGVWHRVPEPKLDTNVPVLRKVPTAGKNVSIYNFTIVDVQRMSKALVDLFSLVEPEYFVGNLFSTFSLSVCMLRGEVRKMASNICPLLIHPEEDRVEVPASGFQNMLSTFAES